MPYPVPVQRVHAAELGVALNRLAAQVVQTVFADVEQAVPILVPGGQMLQAVQLVALAPEYVPAAQGLHTLFVVAEQAELRYLPAVQALGPQAAQGVRPVADHVPLGQVEAVSQASVVAFQLKPAAHAQPAWPDSRPGA